MRLLPLSLAALLIGLSPAYAQDRPLYNSSGGGGSTLYSSGAKPLSLKQITDGRSASGYSYSRSGTGFSPYDGSGGGSYPTAAEVAAFRDRRAAEAQSAEQKALASLAQGHNAQPDPLATPAAVFAGQQQGTPAAGLGGAAQQQPVKKRQRFEGRETGVTIPPKVFNSVR